jgi:hypothetical protein
MSLKSLISVLVFLFVSVANAQVNEIVWGTSSFGGTHPVSLSSDVTGNLTNVGWFDFNTSLGPSSQEGRMYWDAEDGTIAVGMPGGNVTMQVGQEILIKVSNKSGADIKNGDLVYETGSQGNRLTIDLCDIADANTIHLLGMATENIDDDANGYVTMLGLVRGDITEPIDTSGFIEGDKLYMDAAGGWTKTHPTDPAEAVVIIGHVVKAHAETGTIFVVTHESFTLGNEFDGSMRQSVINKSTGTSAAAGFTAVNDGGHRASFSMSGTNNSIGAEIAAFFNEGYGNTAFINDGNVDFVWHSDPTDQHDGSSFANEIMRLSAAGDLTGFNDLGFGGNILPTMLILDGTTTPDVSAGSVYKTLANDVFHTNFDGAEPVGKLLFIHIEHTGITFACGGNFFCGGTRNETLYTSPGDVVVFQRGPTYWRLVSSTGTGTIEYEATTVWAGDEIAVGTRMAVNVQGTDGFTTGVVYSANCLAEGTDADLNVIVNTCNANGTTCQAAGLIMPVANDSILYSDASAGGINTTNSHGWFQFEITAITTPPDVLYCSLKYGIY